MSINDTLSERGEKYGPFSNQAKIVQELKRIVERDAGYRRLNDYQREALAVILHKIGRIVNGDPNHVDNWHDIAGYATLVEQILTQQQSEHEKKPSLSDVVLPRF